MFKAALSQSKASWLFTYKSGDILFSYLNISATYI